MKTGAIIAGVIAVIAVAFGIYMIDIDQTQEGEMPTVSIEDGQMPEFDADVGDVEVTRDTIEVPVPDVEITPPADN